MKKGIRLVGTISTALFFAALSPADVYAGRIEHHGMMVEAEGPAGDCLSCHDGRLAGDISTCTVKCDVLTSHPIMKDYPPATDRERYASADAVRARGIRIVDGKVTCISCHDLQNLSKAHLVVDARSLCQICHVGI